MASIKIVELRPVEAQIEELSYDLTDIIRGGDLPGAYDCVGDGIRDIFLGLKEGISADEILGIWLETLNCVWRELTT